MPSVQRLAITELKTALRNAGFSVYNGIKNHHTGRRPATRSYIEIAQTFKRTSNNITSGAISGPSTLRLKYYKHKRWITNTDQQQEALDDDLQLMEQAFSQVRVNGMQTKFDCEQEESTGGINIGYTTFYTLSVVFTTCQDRGELLGIPVNTAIPVITGIFKEGEELSGSNGTWIGEPTITYTYKWDLNGVDVPGVTSSTWTVTGAVDGDSVGFTVGAENPLTEEPVYASADDVTIVGDQPPVNITPPVLDGTPNPGQILSLSDGAWTGDPLITYSYSYYKDLVLIAGETNDTYEVRAGDVGSDIKGRVRASNPAVPFPDGVDEDSNSLEIVSGWTGIVDTYPGAELVFSNFVQQTPEIPVCNTIQVSAVPSDIGFVNNKFDGDAWDIATTFGVNTAFNTDWYNQNTSGSDASQSTIANESPIDRNGALLTDYASAGSLIYGDTLSTNVNEKLTLVMNYNATQFGSSTYLFSWSGLMFGMLLVDTGVIRTYVNNTIISGTKNLSAYIDGNDHLIIVTLDGSDLIIEIDGVLFDSIATGYTLSITNGPIGLNTSSDNQSFTSMNNLKDCILYNGVSFSPAERADMHEIWKVQNGIV